MNEEKEEEWFGISISLDGHRHSSSEHGFISLINCSSMRTKLSIERETFNELLGNIMSLVRNQAQRQ